MTKEVLFKAQDLYGCISGNRSALQSEQEIIEKLKRRKCPEEGTILVEISDVGFVRILVADIIKVSEQRCEMLKELIEKQQKKFDEL